MNGIPYGPGTKAREEWLASLDRNVRWEMRHRGRFKAIRYLSKLLAQAVLGRL